MESICVHIHMCIAGAELVAVFSCAGLQSQLKAVQLQHHYLTSEQERLLHMHEELQNIRVGPPCTSQRLHEQFTAGCKDLINEQAALSSAQGRAHRAEGAAGEPSRPRARRTRSTRYCVIADLNSRLQCWCWNVIHIICWM